MLWWDADPTGGSLIAGLALSCAFGAGLYARKRRLPAALCAAAAAFLAVGLLHLPVTAYPPHAFRFLCVPFWCTLVFGVLALAPDRFQVAVGATTITILVLAGAGALGRFFLFPVYEGGVFTTRHYIYQPEIGYSPRPDAQVRGRKRRGSLVSYDVEYVHDACGRRQLAVPAHPARALLCFGCSFTYGEGVTGDECWPARIARSRPDWAVYNYAFSGWGPAQVLDLISTRNLEQETPAPARRAVYYFLDSHVQRVTGSWPLISAWAGSLSRYRLRDGRPERVGAFSLTQSVPEFLACHTLGGLGLTVDLPRPPDLPLVASILAAARARIGHLMVVFEPGSCYAHELIPLLERQGVACAQLPADLQLPRLPGDPHPSAEGQRLLAERILAILER